MARYFTRCTICGEMFDIHTTEYYFDDSEPGQFAHADCVNPPQITIFDILFFIIGLPAAIKSKLTQRTIKP